MPPIPRTFTRHVLPLVSMAVLGFIPLQSLAAQTPVARFSTLAVNRIPGGPGAGTISLTITINRWSTEAEHETLMATMMEKNDKALVALVRDMPRVGAIAPFGGIGFDIRYARATKGADGVERIMLLTDRPTSFAEHWYGGRSLDYPYTLVNLAIGPSGTGEGTLTVAARIMVDRFNRNIVIENYDLEPLTLLSVQRQK